MREFLLLCCAFFLFAGCEKPVIETEEQGDKTDVVLKGEYRLTFNAMQVEQTPFLSSTRNETSTQSLAEVCSRISFVVFDGDTKVTATHQTSSEKSFGSASVNLPAGTYTLVIIAHNGLGNPTFSSPSKITFKDNKVTDTFYYCQSLVVDGSKSYDIILSRAVAMFSLEINNATPTAVKRMKFYYTGGSSTFNALEGCGCVASRQTEYRDVPATAYNGESSYELYTFPHNDGRTLKMKVSALGSSDEEVFYNYTFDDIPVAANQVTHYCGYFFGGEEEHNNISVKVIDNWSHISYCF